MCRRLYLPGLSASPLLPSSLTGDCAILSPSWVDCAQDKQSSCSKEREKAKNSTTCIFLNCTGIFWMDLWPEHGHRVNDGPSPSRCCPYCVRPPTDYHHRTGFSFHASPFLGPLRPSLCRIYHDTCFHLQLVLGEPGLFDSIARTLGFKWTVYRIHKPAFHC